MKKVVLLVLIAFTGINADKHKPNKHEEHHTPPPSVASVIGQQAVTYGYAAFVGAATGAMAGKFDNWYINWVFEPSVRSGIIGTSIEALKNAGHKPPISQKGVMVSVAWGTSYLAHYFVTGKKFGIFTILF
jgi:hypothetical protein